MQAIEFQGRIHDGVLEIPKRYRDQLGKQVRVILLTQESASRGGIIDDLLENPIHVADFEPLAREEIYDR